MFGKLIRIIPWKEIVSAAPGLVNVAKNMSGARRKDGASTDRYAGISAMEAVEMLHNDFERFIRAYEDDRKKKELEIKKLKKNLRIALAIALISIAGTMFCIYIATTA